MSEFIAFIAILFVLQYFKGFYRAKGLTRWRMALIGATLSSLMLVLVAIIVASTLGIDYLVGRVNSFQGLLIYVGFILVFAFTYSLEGTENSD